MNCRKIGDFMEYWVIDRWEAGLAICQNDQGFIQEIPKEQFPEGAKEGDYFYFQENNTIVLSSEQTKKRKNLAENLRKRLLLR